MKRICYFFIVIFTLVLIFSGCRKEKEEVDYGLLKDNSLAETSYDDALTMSNQASGGFVNFKSTGEILSNCAIVTIDLVSMPHLMTIDFGDTNCVCNDLKERRGVIIVSFNGAYADSGTVINIGFIDYFVNDNQVIGTKTVENKGHNIDGHLWYSVSVDGAIIKAGTNDTITWVSERTRTWIEGEGTINWFDDVYLIDGSADGVSATGVQYHVEITTDLRREIGCPHFVSGVLLITRPNKPDITVDFGNGDCDNVVTVVLNGTTYNYLL
jgi:hypothetical protein